jgi:apoptosis-resistant E3 ubiquitin protein ligase 1
MDSIGRSIFLCPSLQTVELLPGGSRMIVTNENKFRYLDALAQHRLVHSVKDQVDAFVRGLNELVPDSILSIFDENELEVSLARGARIFLFSCFIN